MHEDGQTKQQLLRELQELRDQVAREPSLALLGRIKQLKCLYGMSHLIEEQFASSSDGSMQQTAILQGVVDSIPRACEHPSLTCARVAFDGHEYRTDNFRDAAVREIRTLYVLGEARGCLEVGYLGPMSSADPAGFSEEERDLFRALGERLGKIVQLVHAEMALRRREATLRTLIDGNPEAVFLIDCQGTILAANDAMARHCRTNVDQRLLDLVGACIYDLSPPDLARQWRTQVEEAMRVCAPRSFEDSREGRHYQHYISPVVEDDGSVRQCAILSLDITVRKRAEEAMEQARDELEMRVRQRTAELATANEELRKEVQQRKWTEARLRESERKLRAVFDQTFQFIGVLTPDGVLVEANRTALAFAGVADSDVLGKPFWETPWWTHSAEMQKQVRAALRMAASGQLTRFEATHRAADGSLAYVDFSAKPVADESGQVVFLVAEGRDVTARRRAEEALRNAMRLQIEAERLAATGRLAARVAHEINNPLAGIKNAFRLLKDAVPEEHPHHKYVGRIDKEISHIADIVRQVFELHRENQETIRDVSVGKTIEEVVGMLEPACRQHEVTITMGDCTPPVVASLPEGSLRQILYNLLANAIEASPAGSNVKIQVQRSENSLGVRVSDQGQGIPEELRFSIFEPFFSTKSNLGQPGLGLGLFISRRIAERLCGSLDYQSEPGKGCVFDLVLPIRLAKGTAL